MRKSWFIFTVCLMGLFMMTHIAHAQEKITGPWLWMIAPTDANQGGQASTDVDSLDKASGGKVKEADVAKNGAKKGDKVGNLDWVEAELPALGGNNIQDMINKGKAAWGGEWAKLPADINDTSSYGLITIVSATAQNGVTMRVGSDDSVKVWLNGNVAHKNAVNRGASGFQDTFKGDLKAGNNLLLVKVSERGGGWSMFAGIQATFTAAGKNYAPTPEPGSKIEGPWLWVSAPTTGGKCGASATKDDWLAAASGNKVTEAQVARNGAFGGQAVGTQVWTVGKIAPTGGNNINDLFVAIKLGTGDINNTVAYGLINLDIPTKQSTRMFVGSDDAIKVWLNGAVVWENAVNRGAGDFQENFPVELNAGNNVLLVAVYECGGGFSGFFGLAQNAQFSLKAPVAVEPAGKLVTTWGRLKKG